MPTSHCHDSVSGSDVLGTTALEATKRMHQIKMHGATSVLKLLLKQFFSLCLKTKCFYLSQAMLSQSCKTPKWVSNKGNLSCGKQNIQWCFATLLWVSLGQTDIDVQPYLSPPANPWHQFCPAAVQIFLTRSRESGKATGSSVPLTLNIQGIILY